MCYALCVRRVWQVFALFVEKDRTPHALLPRPLTLVTLVLLTNQVGDVEKATHILGVNAKIHR